MRRLKLLVGWQKGPTHRFCIGVLKCLCSPLDHQQILSMGFDQYREAQTAEFF